MIRYLKVFGERNCGTNYVSRLLALNLDIRQLPGTAPRSVQKLQHALPGEEWLRDVYFRLTEGHNLGWKHRCVDALASDPRLILSRPGTGVLTLTKNPYSWLLSLFRRHYHQVMPAERSFEDFLQTPWRTVWREHCASRLDHPIELWNIKNRAYLRLGDSGALCRTTESILADPESLVTELADRFSINRTGPFVNHEPSTKDPGKNFDYYRDYYLEERWRAELTDRAAGIIGAKVDARLMQRFGYELI